MYIQFALKKELEGVFSFLRFWKKQLCLLYLGREGVNLFVSTSLFQNSFPLHLPTRYNHYFQILYFSVYKDFSYSYSFWYGVDRPQWLGPIPYDYPEYLTGELPGDYGFDIAGLGKDPVALQKNFKYAILWILFIYAILFVLLSFLVKYNLDVNCKMGIKSCWVVILW